MNLWAPAIFLFCFFPSAALAEPLPFWKAKEKILARIISGEIIVSVSAKATPETAKKNQLNIAGGAYVAAPVGFVYKRLLDFESMVRWSDYVKVAKYDATTKRLKVEIAAYGHKLNLTLAISTTEAAEQKSIHFLVEAGPLTGMSGSVNLVSLPKNKTEVGFAGTFAYDQLPIPKIFVEFGLEVIVQRTAFRLRRSIESDFKSVGLK